MPGADAPWQTGFEGMKEGSAEVMDGRWERELGPDLQAFLAKVVLAVGSNH